MFVDVIDDQGFLDIRRKGDRALAGPDRPTGGRVQLFQRLLARPFLIKGQIAGKVSLVVLDIAIDSRCYITGHHQRNPPCPQHMVRGEQATGGNLGAIGQFAKGHGGGAFVQSGKDRLATGQGNRTAQLGQP